MVFFSDLAKGLSIETFKSHIHNADDPLHRKHDELQSHVCLGLFSTPDNQS